MKPDHHTEMALAAWELWRRCKIRSDRTMAFADCRETAKAWGHFQNLYLGNQNTLPTDTTHNAEIIQIGGRA